MPLEYNGQRIGAIQYNGLTIGEAMYNGQIVYRSVIRITAPAPTFLDLPPWLVLPEVEGVTYTVLGHVAPGQPVEVHAYAEEGYELVGVTRWWRTITNYDPITWSFTTEGNHTITIPEWASEVDIVCIGGGGAGGNGGGAAARAGEGGKAGTYGTSTLQVQNLTSRQLTAQVGGGGRRVTSSGGGTGGSGSNSRVVYVGTSTQVGGMGYGGAGGRGALGDGNLTAGRSAASITYSGTYYSGGSGGAYVNNGGGRVGNSPGGGGGGGAGGIFGLFWTGGAGGDGAVWITARA